MNSITRRNILLLAAVGLLLPNFAQAHPGHLGQHDIAAGALHPWNGVDHILAMLAVGLWASQLGRRAFWAVPATFVTVMVLGGLLGSAGLRMPMMETGIALSVLVLGLFVTTAVRLPLWASMSVVGLFALCHGFAHGTELPENASSLGYAMGFAVSTAVLHLLGMALGKWSSNHRLVAALRLAGAGISVAGVALLF